MTHELFKQIQENKSGAADSTLHLHCLGVTGPGVVMDTHLLRPGSGRYHPHSCDKNCSQRKPKIMQAALRL